MQHQIKQKTCASRIFSIQTKSPSNLVKNTLLGEFLAIKIKATSRKSLQVRLNDFLLFCRMYNDYVKLQQIFRLHSGSCLLGRSSEPNNAAPDNGTCTMATTQFSSSDSSRRDLSARSGAGDAARQEKLALARAKFPATPQASSSTALNKNDALMRLAKGDVNAQMGAQERLRALAGLADAAATQDRMQAARVDSKPKAARRPEGKGQGLDLTTMPDSEIGAIKTGARPTRPLPGEELTANDLRRRQRLEERKLEDQFKPSVIAKILPASIRNKGKFWLAQIGAFAKSMVKGRYNKTEAIRAYEMVQSIL
jgi:hypothetical protein